LITQYVVLKKIDEIFKLFFIKENMIKMLNLLDFKPFLY